MEEMSVKKLEIKKVEISSTLLAQDEDKARESPL